MGDFTKIIAWKLADDLTAAIYASTPGFPNDEIYGLTSQPRRAAYSVPANIAEGASRNSQEDYPHFLYIARGSNSETQYLVHLAHRLGYLSNEEFQPIYSQSQEVGRTLTGLIRSVEKEAGVFRSAAARISSFIVLLLSSAILKSTG